MKKQLWPRMWKTVTAYLAVWAILQETPIKFGAGAFWVTLAGIILSVFYWQAVSIIAKFFKIMNNDIKYIKRKVSKLK